MQDLIKICLFEAVWVVIFLTCLRIRRVIFTVIQCGLFSMVTGSVQVSEAFPENQMSQGD